MPPKNRPKSCELPPPMMSTFVLPAAQTIGLVSGSGASPRPPSFLASALRGLGASTPRDGAGARADGFPHRLGAGGDGDGGRDDIGVEALQHDLRERPLLPEVQREVAQLPPAGEVAGVRAERHLRPDEGVGEVLAVLEHVLFARAVGKRDDDLHRRRAARRVAARRPGPAADAAEKMQACRGDRRRDFDPLREIVREIPAARPALQRDQVRAARGPRRIHHEERHAGHRHVAELVQRDRLVALVFAAEPAAAVRRVGLAQIDDAELLVVASPAGT